MAWTAPKDWATSELVTAANMNTHVRDNLNYLKDSKMDKELFTPGVSASNGATFGIFGIYLVDATQSGSAYLVLPADYSACSSVKVIVYPNATNANANWDISITKFHQGSAHTQVLDTTTTYNFTANQTTFIDLTTLWNSLAPVAGDLVCIFITCATAGHTGYYQGFKISYS